jgi:phosphoribosylanthranilate isomerase
VPLDMMQLHGSESPERVTEVRARTGLPVMKAIGIAEAEDLSASTSIPRSPTRS